MVAVPVLLGADESQTRTLAQVAGEAARMKAPDFVEELKTLPRLARLLQRYAQALMNTRSRRPLPAITRMRSSSVCATWCGANTSACSGPLSVGERNDEAGRRG